MWLVNWWWSTNLTTCHHGDGHQVERIWHNSDIAKSWENWVNWMNGVDWVNRGPVGERHWFEGKVEAVSTRQVGTNPSDFFITKMKNSSFWAAASPEGDESLGWAQEEHLRGDVRRPERRRRQSPPSRSDGLLPKKNQRWKKIRRGSHKVDVVYSPSSSSLTGASAAKEANLWISMIILFYRWSNFLCGVYFFHITKLGFLPGVCVCY